MSEAAGQSIDQEVTCPLTCQVRRPPLLGCAVMRGAGVRGGAQGKRGDASRPPHTAHDAPQIPAAETSPEEEGAKMPTTNPIGQNCPKYEDVYKGIGWCTDSDGNQQYKKL